jgi:esterase
MNSTLPLLNYKVFTPEDNDSQDKAPLLILHGLLGAQDNWRSQAKRLSQFCPVYTLDLRNHGNSPHIKGMSYREMYEDVIRVAQHEGLEQFHLLGHSMGGKVAMQLALAHPEMIKSLIVVDIAPKPYPLWHQKTLGAIMSTPIHTMQSRQEIDDHLKTSIDDESERRFMLKNIKRDPENKNSFIWRVNLEEISRGYLKIAGFSSALATYPNKTLFIAGGLSQYIQEADTSLIHSLFPKAEIITLQTSGHLPHYQQADDFFNITHLYLE